MTTNPETRPVSVETDETLRPLLFSIAYRMAGSFGDAEDLVQETLLRVHRAEADGTKIESRKPYACAVVTRLCIDYLRSARVQREEYVGEWLPEPIVTEPSADPAAQAELSDSLSMAFLVLLESLSPPERAVLLLHDVFGFETSEVAEIIGKSVLNTRQIIVRARRRVEENKPHFEASVETRWILAEKFFEAVEDGDTAGLVELLAEDAVMYGDGGGRAAARRKPTFGREAVAHFLTSVARQAADDDLRISLFEVNGQPGAVARDAAGVTTGVMAIDILDGKVTTVRSIVNPDKLSHI